MNPPLLTRGASSPKLSKRGAGYESVILHLASGRRVCPWATEGCLTGCLVSAGRGAMSVVQAARQRRTDAFFSNRGTFLADLYRELGLLDRRAKRKGFLPVARLNGTSDIPWETLRLKGIDLSLIEAYPDVQFYDYTKSYKRAKAFVAGDMPANYHLTLSRTEQFEDGFVGALCSTGMSVAVVFDTPKGQPLPSEFEGVKVIDGRLDDWRFEDPRGVVVGLSALGKARNDMSGFVVRA